MPRFLARVALAVTFLFHLLSRFVVFWRQRNNSEVFLGHFRHDGILPIGTLEREQMASYQKCQACSLCTFTCTAVLDGSAPAGFEPKYLMLGPGRSPHEAGILLTEWIPCAQCEACTTLCPNDVPIHAMAERIIERGKFFKFQQD